MAGIGTDSLMSIGHPRGHTQMVRNRRQITVAATSDAVILPMSLPRIGDGYRDGDRGGMQTADKRYLTFND